MSPSPKPVARIADARASLFGRLALESGLVTHDQIIECTEAQEAERSAGRQPPRLGELLVRYGYLRERDVENILKMQANPGGLIGRVLRESGVASREQIQECLEEQAENQRLGLAGPKLGELLVRKGYASEADIARALKTRPRQSSLFGRMLVDSGRVTEAQIEECVREQQAMQARGQTPPRLGEMLIRKNLLRREEVELLLRRQTHAYKPKPISVAAGQTVAGGAGARGEGARPGAGAAAMAGFTIHQGIGRNSDGTLYKATHNASGALVTLQVRERTGTPLPAPDLEQLQRRRRLAMTLRHDHIQRVVAVGEDERAQYYAAEYLEGANLRTVLEQEGRIEWHWAVEIACQIAAALAVAGDAGLVHGDLRPGTVFITRAGVCKLSMYASVHEPVANLDAMASGAGRPIAYYCAPEQAVPGAAVDIRADLHALGQTLYHALMGRPMHQGRSFAEALSAANDEAALDALFLNIDLPMRLNGIIARLVQRDPDRRHPDPRALLEDLDALRSDLYADSAHEDGGPAIVGVDISLAEQGGGATAETTREQAALTLTQFLQTRTARPAPRRVGYGELIQGYGVPVLWMVVIASVASLLYFRYNLAHSWQHSAQWYESQGELNRALRSYRAAGDKYPDEATLQIRIRDLGYELGNFAAVEEALTRLRDIFPERRVEYLSELGNVKAGQKYFRPAADYYRAAIVESPPGADTAALRFKHAQAVLWMKDYANAGREFSDLLAGDPNNPQYLINAARAAIGAGDMDAAVKLYDRLRSGGSGLEEAQLKEYAWSLIEAGRKDDLKTVCEDVWRRGATDKYSPQLRAYLLLWGGRLQEARAAFTQLLVDEPYNVELLRGRIAIADQMGDFAAALEDYVNLRRLNPDDEQIALTLARLHQSRQQFASAEALFKQLHQRRPKDSELLRELGLNAAYDKRYADAIPYLRQAIDLAPNDPGLRRSLADVYLWSGDYDSARPILEDALRNDPDDIDARLGLVMVYAKRSDVEPDARTRCVNLARRLLSEAMAPNQLEEFIGALQMLDDNEILVKALEREDADNPAFIPAKILVARRFRGYEQHARAIEFYRQALQQRPDDIALLMEAAETAEWAKNPELSMDWYTAASRIAGLPQGIFPADAKSAGAGAAEGEAKSPISQSDAGQPSGERQRRIDGMTVPDSWLKPQFREVPPELRGAGVDQSSGGTKTADPAAAGRLPAAPAPAAGGEMPKELKDVEAGTAAPPPHPDLLDPEAKGIAPPPASSPPPTGRVPPMYVAPPMETTAPAAAASMPPSPGVPGAPGPRP